MNVIIKKSYSSIFQIFSANIGKAGIGFIGSIFVLRGWSTADIGDIYTLVGVLLLFIWRSWKWRWLYKNDDSRSSQSS
jgi:hypothetical protein